MIAFPIAVLLSAGAPPPLVLVESDLGAACIASAPDLVIREVEAPKDPELESERAWVEKAHEAWTKGRELAFRLETKGAEKRFEEALVSFGRGAPALESFGEYAQTLIDLGALFVDAKKDAQARAAFKRALVLESGDRPTEKTHSPLVVERFDEVAKELLREPRISVSIVGQPEGAEIRWDGRRVGTLPLSIADVLPGDHWLSARHADKKHFFALVPVTKEKNKVEVFMTDAEDMRTIDQRAIAALHQGAPSETESKALAALLEGDRAVFVIARDRSDPGPCRAMYRVHTKRGTTPIASITLPAPFDVAKLLVDPALEASTTAIPIEGHKESVHPIVAIAPFGIGQFAEGRAFAGQLVVFSEVALLAANIVAYNLGRSERNADGTYGDVTRARLLQVFTNVALGLFVVEVVIGAIDGWAHRDEN
jgi:hypothetical protein